MPQNPHAFANFVKIEKAVMSKIVESMNEFDYGCNIPKFSSVLLFLCKLNIMQ
jgi:hypothetical protein